MHSMIQFIWFPNLSPALASLLLDASLKSAIVLAAAGVLCAFWRHASAATRHLIWFLAVVSLPFLLLFSSLLPSWQKPLWTLSGELISNNQVAVAFEWTPAARPASLPSPKAQAAPGKASASDAAQQSPHSQKIGARLSAGWLATVLGVWCTGVLLMLGYESTGWLRLRALRSHTQVVQDSAWNNLLREVSHDLSLRRSVSLIQSPDGVMPATWGLFHPTILLPAEAQAWPEERRRVVLLHELAHVKRWDCLTQFLTQNICALSWFNPLVWMAARQMRIERERACDDLVLAGGIRPSQYSAHLLDIARSFQCIPQGAAIAMAQSTQLGGRVIAIVDAQRNRRRLSPLLAGFMAVLMLGFTAAVAANKSSKPLDKNDPQRFDARLKTFFAEKEQQARALAKISSQNEGLEHPLMGSGLAGAPAAPTASGGLISGQVKTSGMATNQFSGADQKVKKQDLPIEPEVWEYFQAGIKGDWKRVDRLYTTVLNLRPRIINGAVLMPGGNERNRFSALWQTIIETGCAYEAFQQGEKKYMVAFAQDTIQSIPRGSIYFGGTDPGRGLITAYCKSHEKGDPFFTLTQNALTVPTYLEYVRSFYDGHIYVPTKEDAQNCFQEYSADVQKRFQHDKEFKNEAKQMKSGENMSPDDSYLQIGGQFGLMSANALLAKVIFEKNPDREFYVEESFPLDWMYPHLSPNGLIMKINRQPVTEMTEAMVQKDHEYWSKYVKPMIGGWLESDTPMEKVTSFVNTVYLDQDLGNFSGDPRFIADDYSQKMYSKLRSSIAGVYAWRAEHAANEVEKTRMQREADFAFRQAWVMCPYSPEAVYKYVNLLVSENRIADALRLVETSAQFPTSNFESLIDNLKKLQSKNVKSPAATNPSGPGQN